MRVHITQPPTDHYQLPEVADKAINNIGKLPTYMSADTIYLNHISLSHFVNKGIDRLIPTRKQSKEKIRQLNPNQSTKTIFSIYLRLKSIHVPSKTTNVLLQRIH